MAIQPINVGAAANDGTGDHARAAFQKVNANEQYLLGLINAIGGGNASIAVTNFSTGAITITAGDNTTNAEIVSHINTTGFQTTLGEMLVLQLIVKKTIGGAVYWYMQKYLFKRNNLIGSWGTTDPALPGITHRGVIAYEDLILINSEYFLTIFGGTDVYIDLGNIGTSTIENYINAFVGNFPVINDTLFPNDGSVYFFNVVQNSENKTYQYVGSLPVTLGNLGVTTTPADYDLVATSGGEFTPPQQVQADWNESDTAALSFIKNKPAIGADTTSENLTITGAYELNASTMPDTLRATLTGNSTFSFAGTPPVGEVILKNVVLETSTFSLGLPAGTFLGGEVVEGRNVFTFHFMNNTTSGLEVDVFVNLTTVI